MCSDIYLMNLSHFDYLSEKVQFSFYKSLCGYAGDRLT